MQWLAVMILIVFSMVSIAYMIQMPEEKEYNTPRLIRGEPEVEVEPEPVEPVVEPVEPKSKSIVKPVVKHVVRKPIRWHQVSSQYNKNNWKKAKCDNCVYENDIKKADVVFAHPHKTKIKRYHPNQMWVSQFWESEGIYPDINTEKFNAFKSYRRDATFPCYAMMTDTFKPEKMIEPLPYEKKINIEWMSVWLSNCGASGRNSLLKKLQKEGITTASYGKCNRDHSESKLHFSSNEVDIWDRKKSGGNQKIAHSSNHLFLFAAENNISPFYHTEKLYHGFMAGSVPVYYGSDTIDEYVPEHSIIKVSDYGTGLSDYLKKVANDKELYESYLAWRNKPLPGYLTSKLNYKCKDACEICHDLHDMKRGIREESVVESESYITKKESIDQSTEYMSVVSVCIEGKRFNKDFINASLSNKQKWCKHNNIPCFLYDKKHYEHHPKWDKLTRVIDILERGESDWVLWMDCDAVFSNFTISNKDELFDRNYDMITSKDNNGINLGTFLVKKSSIQLLKDMYSMKQIVDARGGHKDQQALKMVMQKQSVSIKYVPQRYMNSFYMNKNGDEWQQGDWIMHQVDCRRPECSQGFLQKVNTLLNTNTKTTLVLMGFSPKRIPNYEILFKGYGSMRNILDKIIFIWNNQDVDPPYVPTTDVDIKIWKAPKNSMVNRYRIYNDTDTVSVLTVDDDVLLSEMLIKELIKTFSTNPDALLGLDERSFIKNKYSFRKNKSNKLVIGKTMMWNKKYAKEFLLDNELVTFSERKPCEDIAMNFLIRQKTGKEPTIVKMTQQKYRKNLDETDGLSIDPTTNWQAERNNCIAFMQTHFSDPYEKLFNMLKDLDTTISKHATEKQVYGNVFSGNAHEQVISYSKHVKDFVKKSGANHICEIGFAGGHSATTLLSATKHTGAKYTAFDIWDREFYENTALKWVKEHFPLRDINIIKGDSTKTVPNTAPLNCDIIHVDGAHHAHYPKTDYINMQRHASANNLLLIDDCTDSWKAVMEGVNYATVKHIFKEKPKKFVPKGWTHRGKKKGWCIGSYSV